MPKNYIITLSQDERDLLIHFLKTARPATTSSVNSPSPMHRISMIRQKIAGAPEQAEAGQEGARPAQSAPAPGK